MSSLIMKSGCWKYIKGKEKRAEKTIYEALDRQVAAIMEKAVENAGKKKTITGEDILGVTIS